MRNPTATGAALAAVVVASGVLAGCSSDDGYEQRSTEVAPVTATEVRAGAVEVLLPAGAASGGELAVQEGPEPSQVPAGMVPLGPTAMVSLFDGTLEGTMTVSFDVPADLVPGQVPVVMAKDDDGAWQWRPTAWAGDTTPITAELTAPGEVFLGRFDRAPLLADVAEEFTAKTNNPARVRAPECGDEDAAVDDGVQVSSEQGEQVRWCVGVADVDTMEPAPAEGTDLSAYDEDPYTDGVQTTVLRLTNNSRMFQEVGFPDDWPVVETADGPMVGQELRERLGFAGATLEGLATRLLGSGETLTLLLPSEPAGTVTADLSAAAWTLSALDFAAGTYTRVVNGVDEELGDDVRVVREGLMASWTRPAPDGTDDTGETGDTAPLRECLAPVAQLYLMNQDTAEQLVAQASTCAAELLRPTVSQSGVAAAQMADGVASDVLAGLPPTLELEPDAWSPVSDTMTDANAGFQVWVGAPPAQELDYSDAPKVFRPGDEVDVQEWSTEFSAYVQERLAALPEEGAAADGTCAEGSFTVERYRSDGFALAGQVTCAGEPWRLVLARLDDGWSEIDQIQQDPHFGCSVMGSYSVPAFIAGDTCLEGDQSQEYTG